MFNRRMIFVRKSDFTDRSFQSFQSSKHFVAFKPEPIDRDCRIVRQVMSGDKIDFSDGCYTINMPD